MAAAAHNVVDLASYRTRKAQAQAAPTFAQPMMPVMQFAWVPVWFVPVMPTADALGHG